MESQDELAGDRALAGENSSAFAEATYKNEVRRYYAGMVETMLPANPIFDAKLRILRERCTRSIDVLDAGCGNGNFGLAVSEDVKSLFGCDLTFEMVKRFAKGTMDRGTSNVSLVNGDLSAIPFASGRFDLLYSYSTLYYIREIETVLSEFHRVLKPGGIAVLDFATNMNPQAWHSRWRYNCPQFFLSPWKIDRLVKSAGFSILEKRHFHLVPTFLIKPLGLPLFKLIGARTIDEWVSSMPLFRNFAFKVILIGAKKG